MADDEHIAGGALENLAIANQNGLCGAGVYGVLAQQHIGQQGNGLDIAAVPANVLDRDRLDAVGRHGRNRRAHDEDGGGNAGGNRVVAFRIRAPGHLQVEILVARAGDQPRENRRPFGIGQGR